MRLVVGVGLLAALYSCAWIHPDYIARSSGERVSNKPIIFLHLGNASQVCANSEGIAHIVVFANLINLPPQQVRFVFDSGQAEMLLFGHNFTVNVPKVSLGEHSVEVSTAGALPVRVTWSVWEC
jgi:hypothetical protein